MPMLRAFLCRYLTGGFIGSLVPLCIESDLDSLKHLIVGHFLAQGVCIRDMFCEIDKQDSPGGWVVPQIHGEHSMLLSFRRPNP